MVNVLQAFQKGSPLVSEISRGIAKLREGGKLMMMEKKWFKSHQSTITKYQNSPNSRTLSLDSFWGLFIVTGVSSALALLWFMIYFLHEYLQVINYMYKIMGSGRLVAVMARYFFPRNDNIVVEEINET